MDRAEHLAWCKERAIKEFEYSGKGSDALASMTSDLGKHDDTRGSVSMCVSLGMGLVSIGQLDSAKEVEDFINGFN